jgi:hypothetical protein
MMMGHRFAGRAQAAAHGEPVLAGQHEVEDHEARRIALQLAVEVARIGSAVTWNPCSPR